MENKTVKWVVIILAISALGWGIMGIERCKAKAPGSNYYAGIWRLYSDEDLKELLNQGLVWDLELFEDGRLKLWAEIGNERTLLNEGEWKFQSYGTDIDFTLPDREYGGTIKGTMRRSGDDLIYRIPGMSDAIYKRRW